MTAGGKDRRMTIREFRKCVEFNIRHGIKHAILGLGAPGVGKSQSIRELGEEYGYKVIDLRLAQMSEVEIGGLIYPDSDRSRTIWLTPDILPDEKRDGEKTILLLDEITSCSRRVQVAAYQLILDRRIGQYRLPEGTYVIALGNREDDEGVFIQLSAPLADRFEIHFIEADLDVWMQDFAIPKGIHPLIRDFLAFKPSALIGGPEEGEMIFPTPRSWERVSDILKIDDNIYDNTIRHKILGNIGAKEGGQFIEYCTRRGGHVSPAAFIRGNMSAPDNPDELKLLISGMLKMVEDIEKIPQAGALSGEQRDCLEQVIRALFRLPKAEYTMTGLKGLADMNRPVVKVVFSELEDARIMEFIRNNSYALGLEGEILCPPEEEEKEKWLKIWNNNDK